MQTNTQVPGNPPAEVEAKVDNISGAELAAAFLQRRSGRPTAPAIEDPNPESQPAESTEPETPPAAEAAPETSDADSTPKTETTEPQAESQPAPEDEPEAEETPETPGIKSMQERIDKLTARLREAERRLEDNKGEKPKAAPAPVGGVFDHDQELQQLNTQINEWRAVEQWLMDNPDGGEVIDRKTGQVTQVISQQEARRLRIETEDSLSDLRVQRDGRKRELRANHDNVRAQAEQLVAQTFAWSKDEKAPQHELIRSIENTVPEIKRLPGWKLYAAHAVDSMMKWQESQNQARKPAPKPAAKPPRVAAPNGATAPRVDPLKKELSEAESAYEKSGRPNDFKRVLELKQRVRRNAAPA